VGGIGHGRQLQRVGPQPRAPEARGSRDHRRGRRERRRAANACRRSADCQRPADRLRPRAGAQGSLDGRLAGPLRPHPRR
jgi:hypothetical protein